jgi:ABC-type branched-subunit amino acid transport system ATPase component
MLHIHLLKRLFIIIWQAIIGVTQVQRGMIQIKGHGAPKKTPKKTLKNPKTYLKWQKNKMKNLNNKKVQSNLKSTKKKQEEMRHKLGKKH